MDAQQTEGFAEAWIQAWNRRDLEAVLSHYIDTGA
jgi:ketosteroid isomerase-like protein